MFPPNSEVGAPLSLFLGEEFLPLKLKVDLFSCTLSEAPSFASVSQRTQARTGTQCTEDTCHHGGHIQHSMEASQNFGSPQITHQCLPGRLWTCWRGVHMRVHNSDATVWKYSYAWLLVLKYMFVCLWLLSLLLRDWQKLLWKRLLDAELPQMWCKQTAAQRVWACPGWAGPVAAGPPCWEQAGPLLVPLSQLWSHSSPCLKPKQMQAEVRWKEEGSSVLLEGTSAMWTSQGCLIIGLIC